jgi:nitrate reductase NapE component
VWFCWIASAIWVGVVSVVVVNFASNDFRGITSVRLGAIYILFPVILFYIGVRTFSQLRKEESSKMQRFGILAITLIPLLSYLLIPIIGYILWILGQLQRQ